MAAIVCHELQSHLASQLVESRTLRLRLPSSKPSPSQSIDLALKSYFWDSNIKPHDEENEFQDKEKSIPSNPNMGCGIFLEALSNVSQSTKEPSHKETTYVHPQQKRSSLLLSSESLELCTENLGNESGTHIAENGIDMLSSPNCAGGNSETREQSQFRQPFAAKKAKTQNFPPPLTTIRGSESLRVRPHREDGRLVIQVTKVPLTSSCFQAERSHGRLRLCFLTNHAPSFDQQEDDDARENEPTTNDGLEEEFENEMNGQAQYFEEEEEEGDEQENDILQETEEKTEQETEEEGDVACGCECEVSDVIKEKYERLRRCKEGGKHENNELLLNWSEPRWVATS
ncbi:protein FANTASTIC FOUR 3 [Abrus precatorius]|uniref:Protein FANTASTIC FOUR 3 n=1 Tax=Abrus precatorius TaxID=3816 RepID=A0A8B8MFZ5_ABRPR|nr:protein FANTASTIC FOUR 3 [Abrus precatorius]